MIPREKIITKFENIFDDHEKAQQLELEIFNHLKTTNPNLEEESEEFIELYLETSRSIYDNLNPKSYFNTTEAKEKLDKEKWNVTQNIQYLRYKNLWKIIRQNQEILDKNLMDLKPTTETDQFLCKKCNNRKTTFYTMQIRSADEAETSFITCLVCNYSWREG